MKELFMMQQKQPFVLLHPIQDFAKVGLEPKTNLSMPKFVQYPASDVLNNCCTFKTGIWKRKRKRLIFCGSGSTLMKEVGSGRELGSKSVEKELEAEAIFSKSGASGF